MGSVPCCCTQRTKDTNRTKTFSSDFVFSITPTTAESLDSFAANFKRLEAKRIPEKKNMDIREISVRGKFYGRTKTLQRNPQPSPDESLEVEGSMDIVSSTRSI